MLTKAHALTKTAADKNEQDLKRKGTSLTLEYDPFDVLIIAQPIKLPEDAFPTYVHDGGHFKWGNDICKDLQWCWVSRGLDASKVLGADELHGLAATEYQKTNENPKNTGENTFPFPEEDDIQWYVMARDNKQGNPTPDSFTCVCSLLIQQIIEPDKVKFENGTLTVSCGKFVAGYSRRKIAASASAPDPAYDKSISSVTSDEVIEYALYTIRDKIGSARCTNSAHSSPCLKR